jgi:hypothetical protein
MARFPRKFLIPGIRDAADRLNVTHFHQLALPSIWRFTTSGEFHRASIHVRNCGLYLHVRHFVRIAVFDRFSEG